MASDKREPKSMAEGLRQGLHEAIRYSKGQLKAKEHAVEVPGPAPKWTAAAIRRLRKEGCGLSQPLFAALLNVTPSTVRSWEQGQKTPSGAAARLLQLLSLNPAVLELLVA
ncbi:helix-turn-helix domain-containing protein [Bdellovibrionota bacterium FG-1]